MYMNTAYINDSLLNYKDTKNPLSIVSCGMYRLTNLTKLPTYRPKGRLDYQLIYIASGTGHFYFEDKNKETIVSAGTLILYRPKEYQNYVYYGDDKTEAYWIHFTGNNVKNILKQYAVFENQKIIKVGTKQILIDTFQNIIQEIQQKQEGYKTMVESYFIQLLVHIQREAQRECNSDSYINQQMELARKYFDENYYLAINIEKYASAHGMSISWFIRNFKQYTGSTPLQYILHLKLLNAQMLLESTDYTIKEISSIIGYENQLYFSRLFKKQKGMSPQEYRNRIT